MEIVAAILKANQDLLANKYQVLCFCTEKQKIIDHIFQWMLSRIPGNCNIESNQDLSKYQVLGFRDTKQQKILNWLHNWFTLGKGKVTKYDSVINNSIWWVDNF